MERRWCLIARPGKGCQRRSLEGGEEDFADATLVWVAELVNTLDVMTIDRRDFEVYRLRGGKAFNLVLS